LGEFSKWFETSEDSLCGALLSLSVSANNDAANAAAFADTPPICFPEEVRNPENDAEGEGDGEEKVGSGREDFGIREVSSNIVSSESSSRRERAKARDFSETLPMLLLFPTVTKPPCGPASLAHSPFARVCAAVRK
jgi:hypothetical protein